MWPVGTVTQRRTRNDNDREQRTATIASRPWTVKNTTTNWRSKPCVMRCCGSCWATLVGIERSCRTSMLRCRCTAISLSETLRIISGKILSRRPHRYIYRHHLLPRPRRRLHPPLHQKRGYDDGKKGKLISSIKMLRQRERGKHSLLPLKPNRGIHNFLFLST